MTIASALVPDRYEGNGVTTSFAYTFRVDDKTHIYAVKRDSDGEEEVLTVDVDYTVNDVGEEDGGTITYPISGDELASGEYLLITRVVPFLQSTDLENNATYYAETLEDALDYLTFITQQLGERVDRAIKADISAGETGDEFRDSYVDDLDSKVSAAQLAQTNAETAETNAETAEDNCEAQLVLCQAEVVNCQTEVTNCQAEVVLCQAEVVNCQDEVDLCEAQVVIATNWATKTDAIVDGDYSSKEWAVGIQTRGVASSGSAKDWATYMASTVDDTDYSAKYWANEAAVSAASVSIPDSLVGQAGNLIRVKGDETGYEFVTDFSLAISAGDAGKIPVVNAGETAYELKTANDAVGLPVGMITPWIAGYFGDGSNGSYTRVLGTANTIAAANAFLNASGWYVCDGAALNDADSPIFNGASRYLPNLTDDRFIMGGADTTTGDIGGSSTMAHTHGVTSNVAVGNHTALTATYPAHKHQIAEYDYSAANVEYLKFYNSGGTATTILYTSNLTPYTSSGANYPASFSSSLSADITLYSKTDGGGSVTFTQNISAHSVTNNAVTSGAASVTENRPKYLSCFYIMKVK